MQRFPQSDTTPEADAMMIDLLRAAPAWKKMEIVFGLCRTCDTLALADLKQRYPLADAAELRKRLAARIFTRTEVIAAFGWDPEIEGY
jgi:hypothetical protein